MTKAFTEREPCMIGGPESHRPQVKRGLQVKEYKSKFFEQLCPNLASQPRIKINSSRGTDQRRAGLFLGRKPEEVSFQQLSFKVATAKISFLYLCFFEHISKLDLTETNVIHP